MSYSNGTELSQEEIFALLKNRTDKYGLIISKGITKYPAAISSSMMTYVWASTSVSGIGIIGNLLVLIVCLRNFRNVTPFKFLTGHLAFCNSIFSFTQIFNIAGNGWYNGRISAWMFNSTLCKLSKGSSHLSSLVSVGAILAITVERFVGIRQGMLSNTPNVWKKVLAGICLIWIVAVSSNIPVFVSTRLDNQTCQEEWKDYFDKEWLKMYSIYLLLAFCLIPMAAMILMNGMMILELKKPIQSSILYDSMLENLAQARKRRDMGDAKILVTIITVFFICILPTRSMFVASSFCDPESLKTTDTFSIVYTVNLLHSFHVAVNAVIYVVVDKSFRKHLIGIIFCCERAEAENETSSLISESNNSLDSLELCIHDKTSKL